MVYFFISFMCANVKFSAVDGLYANFYDFNLNEKLHTYTVTIIKERNHETHFSQSPTRFLFHDEILSHTVCMNESFLFALDVLLLIVIIFLYKKNFKAIIAHKNAVGCRKFRK